MIIEIFSIGALIASIIAIIVRMKENFKLYSLFKPLTTILILGIALMIYRENNSQYALFAIIALTFSLLGDIFLITDKYFIFGLASFLIAHIFFAIGFLSIQGFALNYIPLIVLLSFGVSYFLFLRRYLHKYTFPVVIYLIAIIIMSWFAMSFVFNEYSNENLAIASAAILFTFSDSIIAYSKFVKPFKLAQFLILSTYWISIYIFAIVGMYIR